MNMFKTSSAWAVNIAIIAVAVLVGVTVSANGTPAHNAAAVQDSASATQDYTGATQDTSFGAAADWCPDFICVSTPAFPAQECTKETCPDDPRFKLGADPGQSSNPSPSPSPSASTPKAPNLSIDIPNETVAAGSPVQDKPFQVTIENSGNETAEDVSFDFKLLGNPPDGLELKPESAGPLTIPPNSYQIVLMIASAEDTVPASAYKMQGTGGGATGTGTLTVATGPVSVHQEMPVTVEPSRSYSGKVTFNNYGVTNDDVAFSFKQVFSPSQKVTKASMENAECPIVGNTVQCVVSKLEKHKQTDLNLEFTTSSSLQPTSDWGKYLKSTVYIDYPGVNDDKNVKQIKVVK